MFAQARKSISRAVVAALCAVLMLSGMARAAPQDFIRVKELNFVFLHGMGANCCTFQLLVDTLNEYLPSFGTVYEAANPGSRLRMNTLVRCYPGYASIGVWARNVVESIKDHYGDKRGLILVGHSMGGKTALHVVAADVGGIADQVAAVVTINSPVKNLDQYQPPGAGPVLEYCRSVLLGSDEGVCSSVVFLDSSKSGRLVAERKHWLAFISGERAPLSPQFNRAGVDVWPRDMDDGVVPLSAQHAAGADVVYYGEHGHSDFGVREEVAALLADRILRYVLGEYVECSVFARGGEVERRADWLLGTEHWDDILGEVVATSGTLEHRNDSWTEWQVWEDVIGGCREGEKRSRTQITQTSIPLLTRIEELRWLKTDDPFDCQLYVKTRAAPRTTVRTEWAVYARGLLPEGTRRSHYEIEIVEGTPLSTVTDAAWLTDDRRDMRLRVLSEAQSPFRWFRAEWRVYYQEERRRPIIGELPVRLVPRGCPLD